jgi:hydroxymethylbilane synthase
MGGKGLFTKELEEALLEGRAHVAVHSAKDLPTILPEGLMMAGYLPRGPAHDVLLSRTKQPKVIATGSPRRKAQLKRIFPEAEFIDIRGSIETRIKKIEDGYADATVLAYAGLERLGLVPNLKLGFYELTLDECVPAPGQGAIGLECSLELAPLLKPSLDKTTEMAVSIERSFLKVLGGGCQSAFAAHYTAPYLRVFHESIGYAYLELKEPDFANIDAYMLRTIHTQLPQLKSHT